MENMSFKMATPTHYSFNREMALDMTNTRMFQSTGE